MKKRVTITMDELEQLNKDNQGLCVKCGAFVDNVEPDAEGYDCDDCHAASVYGAESAIYYVRVT